MLPDRVSNPGPLTYESGALPIALRGPALLYAVMENVTTLYFQIVGSRSYMAVKVHISLFYVYPIPFMWFKIA